MKIRGTQKSFGCQLLRSSLVYFLRTTRNFAWREAYFKLAQNKSRYNFFFAFQIVSRLFCFRGNFCDATLRWHYLQTRGHTKKFPLYEISPKFRMAGDVTLIRTKTFAVGDSKGYVVNSLDVLTGRTTGDVENGRREFFFKDFSQMFPDHSVDLATFDIRFGKPIYKFHLRLHVIICHFFLRIWRELSRHLGFLSFREPVS